jgi:hypothetical protein
MEDPVNGIRKDKENIMQRFVENAVVGLCIAATFLLFSSIAGAQVLANSGEVAGTVGYDHTSMTNNNPPAGNPTSNHFFSGSGGYNMTRHITALGEYKFDPLAAPPLDTFTWHSQLYGGAVRYNFTPSRKIVPYAIVGIGYYQLTASMPGVIENASGYYVNFGGGASYYLGKHWGIRPEFRYERQHAGYKGEILTSNVADLSGSIFYQFGGTGNKNVASPLK